MIPVNLSFVKSYVLFLTFMCVLTQFCVYPIMYAVMKYLMFCRNWTKYPQIACDGIILLKPTASDSNSAAWRPAVQGWPPIPLLHAVLLYANRTGSPGKRTWLGVHSKFQIVHFFHCTCPIRIQPKSVWKGDRGIRVATLVSMPQTHLLRV